jgi:hypothetical protein
MKDETVTGLARILSGAGILITHMITGANSTFVLLGVFLLGVPVELVQAYVKKEKE